jgi:hypothetical protein
MKIIPGFPILILSIPDEGYSRLSNLLILSIPDEDYSRFSNLDFEYT